MSFQVKHWPIWVVVGFCAFLFPGLATAKDAKGLSDSAFEELEAVGLNKYLGQYTPVSVEDVGDGWVTINGCVCLAI